MMTASGMDQMLGMDSKASRSYFWAAHVMEAMRGNEPRSPEAYLRVVLCLVVDTVPGNAQYHVCRSRVKVFNMLSFLIRAIICTGNAGYIGAWGARASQSPYFRLQTY